MKLFLLATLVFALAACDTQEPDTAQAPEANLMEQCRMSTGNGGNRYYRMVNGNEYEISEGAYMCLCNNGC